MSRPGPMPVAKRKSLAAQGSLWRDLERPLKLSIGAANFQILFPREELYQSAARRYRGFEATEDTPFSIRLLDSAEPSEDPGEFQFEWQGAELRCRNGEAIFRGVRHEYA